MGLYTHIDSQAIEDEVARVANLPIDKKSYIASVDVGTTTLRCCIYDENAVLHCKAEEKMTLLSPNPGWQEIDPEHLWQKFLTVTNDAIGKSGFGADQISCMGLCTQRATFTLWDRRNGMPLHNFITWKDIRANSIVNEWNKSWTLKFLHFFSRILYNVSRKKRYLAGSVLKLMNIQVIPRLMWVLENDEKVKMLLPEGNVLFGTIDTWLVYRLTKGEIHATDFSNASSTALYDPFLLDWGYSIMNILRMQMPIFPNVRDTAGDWGSCAPEWFGAEIPITAVVSDQGASLYGSCGFNRGDVKLTLGTGAFIDVNTGGEPHASIAGIYPVIGWKDKEGIVYMAEGSSNDNGTVVDWGVNIGLYPEAKDCEDIAKSVPSSGGVCFIPGFNGIQAPINDAFATSGFIGLNADTSRAELVRSMLEALAFRVTQVHRILEDETGFKLHSMRVDGGVTQNNFLLSLISTLTGKALERPNETDASALGCAFLAGQGAGIWKSRSEISSLYSIERIFEPDFELRTKLLSDMKRWEVAMKRFTNWYQEDEIGKKRD